MKIPEKFTGATYSLTGDNGRDFLEGLGSFKYLGLVLHQTDNDWTAVLHNI